MQFALPGKNGEIEWSQENALTMVNYKDCMHEEETEKLNSTPMRRLRKKKCFIKGPPLDPVQVEFEYMKLAKHLVTEVYPRIISKYKQQIDIPLVIHYRCNMLMNNLVVNWLFAMFAPQQVRLSLIDLLKTRNNSGCWNNFYISCGQTFGTKWNATREHIGN